MDDQPLAFVYISRPLRLLSAFEEKASSCGGVGVLIRSFDRLSNRNSWTSSTNVIHAATRAGLAGSKHPETDIENAHHSFKSGVLRIAMEKATPDVSTSTVFPVSSPIFHSNGCRRYQAKVDHELSDQRRQIAGSK